MPQISRQEYAGLFGPTTGDKIRLGDTNLFIEIEKTCVDMVKSRFTVVGNRCVTGWGPTII